MNIQKKGIFVIFVFLLSFPVFGSVELGVSGRYYNAKTEYKKAPLDFQMQTYIPQAFVHVGLLLGPHVRLGLGPTVSYVQAGGSDLLSFNRGYFTYFAYGGEVQMMLLLNYALAPYITGGVESVSGLYKKLRSGTGDYFASFLTGYEYSAGLGLTLFPVGFFSLYLEGGYRIAELDGKTGLASYDSSSASWDHQTYNSDRIKTSGYYFEMGAVFGFGRKTELKNAFDRKKKRSRNLNSEKNVLQNAEE